MDPALTPRPGPPVPGGTPKPLSRVLLSIALLALVGLSWSGLLDQQASARADEQLTRALGTYAVARTLNGVISVAQGTEIALQPAGVGVTLTPGEILDPLNDLVERFSWLVLFACASLGTQLLLGEIFANPWVSAILAAVVGALLVMIWLPGHRRRGPLLRLLATAAFIRFLAATMMFGSAWISQALLHERQDQAVRALTHLSEDLNQQPMAGVAAETESSLWEDLQDMFAAGQQSLDLSRALDELQTKAEAAVAEMINLIVTFVVETLVLPLATLLLAYGALKWFWRACDDDS